MKRTSRAFLMTVLACSLLVVTLWAGYAARTALADSGKLYTPVVFKTDCPKGYNDDFSSSTSGWLVSTTSTAKYSYKSNEYAITSYLPNGVIISFAPTSAMSEYDVTIDVHAASGATDEGFQGLVYGSLSSTTLKEYYIALVYPDSNSLYRGYEVLHRRQDGSFESIKYVIDPGLVKSGSQVNKLRVKVDNGKATVYVNGSNVGSFTMATASSATYIGVASWDWAGAADPDHDDRFDNISRCGLVTTTSTTAFAVPSAPPAATTLVDVLQPTRR